MTQTYTARDGSEHPIRDDHLIYPEGWTARHEAAVLELWKAGEELEPADRAYLEAWTNRNNLENALKFLKGKHYSAYGFATLCQVHGQRWSPDVCDCIVHQVFDHHERHTEITAIHPHHQHKVCDRHAHLKAAPEPHHQALTHVEHHDTLMTECRHKEAVLHAITTMHGLEPHDRPAWRFTENHELAIDTTAHPVLTPQHVHMAIRDQFPDHVIHVV